MKRYVIGDIHGCYNALKQVLIKSDFNYQEDLLIILGDVVDKGEDSKSCVDELLKIENKILVLGNHDLWCRDWMITGEKYPAWLMQGGIETIKSYVLSHHDKISKPDVPESHIDFFRSGVDYYISDDNRLFVHGGFELDKPIEKQSIKTFSWDRSLWTLAKKNSREDKKLTAFDEVYIGHTPTVPEHKEPVQYCEVWNMDQGSGVGGDLSIMDVNTKEFWVSEISNGYSYNKQGNMS